MVTHVVQNMKQIKTRKGGEGGGIIVLTGRNAVPVHASSHLTNQSTEVMFILSNRH